MAYIVLSDRLIEMRRGLHHAMELIDKKEYSEEERFLHMVDILIGDLLSDTRGVVPVVQ